MRIKPIVGVACLAWLVGAIVVCGPTSDEPGSDGGGDPDTGVTAESIEVAPDPVVLEVVDGASAEQVLTATAHLADGSTRDVSAEAVWSVVNATLGTFSGSTFTAAGNQAGTSTLQATWGGVTGVAAVTVTVRGARVVDPAPANAPDLFAAATEQPALGPILVYPPDLTVIPPNLGDFEVHWNGAGTTDLYEVRLQGPDLDLRLYTVGTPTAAGSWERFLATEWAVAGNSYRGQEVTVTVRGLATATPGEAGTSGPRTVRLADEDMSGGIYYWAAASAQGLPEGIYRHDFDRPGEPAEEFYTVNQEPGGRCVACHALSRAGDRMAITYDGGNGPGSLLDVATRTTTQPADGTYHFNFAAFHPEGTRLATVYQGVISLRDPDSFAVLATVPTPGYGTQMDWSPDGDALVFVAVDSPSADWYFQGGHLMTVTYDLVSDSFGTPVDLVPAEALNIFYPAWSPDGDWIVFNKSDEDCYDDVNSQLWVVRADGTQPPMYLAAADISTGITNSWPRWAPFEQLYTGGEGEGSEPLLWFTFSSKRGFGVRLAPGSVPQVWMSAFFPERAAAGQDPTVPAFRLPFQEIDSNNHIAQWTEVVVPVN